MPYPRFLTLLFTISVITSCSKKEQQHFSGRVIESCDNRQPVVEATVEIYFLEKGVPGLGGATGRTFNYTTTTDESGTFNFHFKEKDWPALLDAGTFGAELRVNNETVLSGISSEDSELGEIIREYRETIRLSASISASGLGDEDSVFIQENFIGRGNFANQQDTLQVRLCNRADPGNPDIPVFMESRSACLNWQIRRGDSVVKNGQFYQALEHTCDSIISATLTIEL